MGLKVLVLFGIWLFVMLEKSKKGIDGNPVNSYKNTTKITSFALKEGRNLPIEIDEDDEDVVLDEIRELYDLHEENRYITYIPQFVKEYYHSNKWNDPRQTWDKNMALMVARNPRVRMRREVQTNNIDDDKNWNSVDSIIDEAVEEMYAVMNSTSLEEWVNSRLVPAIDIMRRLDEYLNYQNFSQDNGNDEQTNYTNLWMI